MINTLLVMDKVFLRYLKLNYFFSITFTCLFIFSIRSSVYAEDLKLNLLDMSFEELMNVPISSGTLTGSTRATVPATITTITNEDIKLSGARNLKELLEIYVPGIVLVNHAYEAQHLGIRGVISDRDNKYLYVVNGKVMNNLTHAGAMSELDLISMRDISEISVIRGPGSVVYGAGAITGVIEVKTFNSNTAPSGSNTTLHAGLVDENYTLESSVSSKFSDGSGIYIHASGSELIGADSDRARYVSGVGGTAINGINTNSSDNTPGVDKFNNDYRDLPPLKFHIEYDNKDFSSWLRYSRGGEVLDREPRFLFTTPDGFPWVTSTNPNSIMNGYSVGYSKLLSEISILRRSLILQI